MTTVIIKGEAHDFFAAVQLMDEEIRENLHKTDAVGDWFHAAPKVDLVVYAMSRGLEIGQPGGRLFEDWADRVMDQKFMELYCVAHKEKFNADFAI